MKNAPAQKRVVLGFCQANKMSNENGILLAEGRKQVYCVYFTSLKEINDEQIKALLFEAELIDQEFKKKKTGKKKFRTSQLTL